MTHPSFVCYPEQWLAPLNYREPWAQQDQINWFWNAPGPEYPRPISGFRAITGNISPNRQCSRCPSSLAVQNSSCTPLCTIEPQKERILLCDDSFFSSGQY